MIGGKRLCVGLSFDGRGGLERGERRLVMIETGCEGWPSFSDAGAKTEPNTRRRPALRGTVESIAISGSRALCWPGKVGDVRRERRKLVASTNGSAGSRGSCQY